MIAIGASSEFAAACKLGDDQEKCAKVFGQGLVSWPAYRPNTAHSTPCIVDCYCAAAGGVFFSHVPHPTCI